MYNEIKIAIVDDHAMFRKSLRMLIQSFPHCKVMADAANGKEFTHQLDKNNLPDIVLLDIDMPEMNGYETAAWLMQHYPNIKILALSTMDAETAIIKMIKCGANGYILKDAEPEELKAAFNQVLTKGFFYNDLVSRKVVQSLRLLVDEKSSVNTIMKLTDRETEFVKQSCSEKSYKQIAGEMFASESAIDGLREALFKKFDVTTRVGLVMYAIKNGIVKL
ncbi:MAG: response regulator transcription factor [Chitinophagaceae bacterium]|jgi:DNA-binding NarL/FixJ family response regulator|nr:response regulator transcription factor [Chitinophagaceae bacterium]